MARICTGTAAELPMTFSMSSTLEEMLTSGISTIRAYFSSTIELAMPMPEVMAVIIHTMPKSIPRK